MVTLNKIKKYETTSDLEKFVKEEIIYQLEGYDKAEDFFNDLFNHGCVSGMIGSLIYYTDTKKFYTDFSSEIDDLIDEAEESTGEPLQFKTPKTNSMAWFGFEETARHIYSECGGEEW